MELFNIYESLGLSRAVFDRGEAVLAGLADRFRAIDRTAEYNQAKVLSSMQKNRVGAKKRKKPWRVVLRIIFFFKRGGGGGGGESKRAKPVCNVCHAQVC